MGDTNMIQKPFSWDEMYIYLSGSIDYAPDNGVGWRDIITKKLINIEVPRNHILNPLKKPIQNISANLNNESQVINERRQAEDWVGLVDVMSEIVHVDLRLVDLSSIVIVNFSIDSNGQRVPSYFTIGELQAAKKQRKPIFVIWPGGKKTCSAYIMWLSGPDNIFETDDDLVKRLNLIRSGEYPYNSKDWLLLNLEGQKSS